MAVALSVVGVPEGETDGCRLSLLVTDPETVAELEQRGTGRDRDEFALHALRIGVLALRQARGLIDGEQIRQEGDRLLQELQHRLEHHATGLDTRLQMVLKEYFDPQSGRFQDRVERLIKQDGELEQVMRRHVGDEASELNRTLLRHMGEESPLLKRLSPDESQGILGALRGVLEQQLEAQKEQVLGQFSLDNKEGALARFIGELTQHQADLNVKLQQRLDEVVGEFSLDTEDSALSRLVANVERAQRTITNEFSLDHEASALSKLSKLLHATNASLTSELSLDVEDSALGRLKRELLALMESQSEGQQKFQEEVKLTLREMVTRKQEAARSTRHGEDFEVAVLDVLDAESRKLGDVLERTGNMAGAMSRCKTGDGVIVLGPESAAPDARIVIEAKEDASYKLANAREEARQARDNRTAQISVFVFSKRTAPANQEPLLRLGSDIFVIWDADDDQSDLYLKVAYTLARALAIRIELQSQGQAADFAATEGALLEIERQLESLEQLKTWSNTIRNNSDNAMKLIDKLKKTLEAQVQVIQEKTAALKQQFGMSSKV